MGIALHQIETFLKVAETGSFSSAAKKLGYSASALTQAMNALEKNMGFRLFERTSQGVTLTNAGRLLFDEGLPLIEQLESLLKACRELDGSSSSVRVGMLDNLTDPRLYSGTIMSFAASHIDFGVSVAHIERDAALSMIESRKIDVCFCIDEKTAQLRGLGYQPLTPMEICLLMNENDSLYEHDCVNPTCLSGRVIACNKAYFSDAIEQSLSNAIGIEIILDELDMEHVTKHLSKGHLIALPLAVAHDFSPFVVRTLNPAPMLPAGMAYRKCDAIAIRSFVDWMGYRFPA